MFVIIENMLHDLGQVMGPFSTEEEANTAREERRELFPHLGFEVLLVVSPEEATEKLREDNLELVDALDTLRCNLEKRKRLPITDPPTEAERLRQTGTIMRGQRLRS